MPNEVLDVKRDLGDGKRFMVDCDTWTCPELKTAGCHFGTLEEFFLWQKQVTPPQPQDVLRFSGALNSYPWIFQLPNAIETQVRSVKQYKMGGWIIWHIFNFVCPVAILEFKMAAIRFWFSLCNIVQLGRYATEYATSLDYTLGTIHMSKIRILVWLFPVLEHAW